MLKVTTPPRLFAAISFLMIIAMVVGTGLIQAPFFRQSIIDREAAIVQDLVYALTVDRDVSASDMHTRCRERLDVPYIEKSKRLSPLHLIG